MNNLHEIMTLSLATEYIAQLKETGTTLNALPIGMERLKLISALTRECIRKADTLTGELAAKAGQELVALDCRRGCNHCCKLSVSATFPELFHILNALSEMPNLEQLVSKIHAAARLVVNLQDPLQRLAANISCPLLSEDGGCLVYEARPISCRTYFARSESSCIEAAASATQGMDGMMDHFGPGQIAKHIAQAGLIATLAEAKIEPLTEDLVLGLSTMFRLEDKQIFNWTGGQNPFGDT